LRTIQVPFAIYIFNLFLVRRVKIIQYKNTLIQWWDNFNNYQVSLEQGFYQRITTTAKLPKKVTLPSKVVKTDSKIITSLVSLNPWKTLCMHLKKIALFSEKFHFCHRHLWFFFKDINDFFCPVCLQLFASKNVTSSQKMQFFWKKCFLIGLFCLSCGRG